MLPHSQDPSDSAQSQMGFEEQELTHHLFGICLEIHQRLGAGLNQNAYEEALEHELRAREFFFERNKSLTVDYRGNKIENASTLSFLIENSLVVEILSQPEIGATERRSMKTKLGLSNNKTGLLVNFDVSELREGLVKVVISDQNTAAKISEKKEAANKADSAKTW